MLDGYFVHTFILYENGHNWLMPMLGRSGTEASSMWRSKCILRRQRFQKFSAFYGTQCFTTTFTIALCLSLLDMN
jgi:hypothetical protein